ncbi:MAG: transposase [Candidatus Acidiferrales bacterium]
MLLNFLRRLLRLTRKTRRKLFLIADGHPAHKSRSVSRWLAEHAAQIRLFWLPSYSPELSLMTDVGSSSFRDQRKA